jgi:hypothetical protein
MTEPTRSARPRRSGRRPGWLLLTVLLVLAIGASSALVFTNRVELLKLAVILALWAAVVAAFVSVVYRRQSDIDQAKVRDLKLVYDLQLDREISARREYELSVETQLRRELVSEVRAQAADEVAGLRAELAALRAHLEILFDADLSDRPALEFDRSRARPYSDWSRTPETSGRVTASRIDTEDREDTDFHTDESPIIDVPEEPHPPEFDWAPTASGGVHRRPSEMEREGRRYRAEEPRAWSPPPAPPPRPTPPPRPAPRPTPPPTPAPPPPAPPPTPEVERTTEFPWPPAKEPPKPAPPPKPPEPAKPAEPAARPDWEPAPSEGQWIPAGSPGSNWVSPEAFSSPQPAADNGASEYVGKRRAPEPGVHSEPAMSTPAPEPRRGRHSAPPDAVDPGRPVPPPTLATESPQPPAHPEPETTEARSARHRSADESDTGGQSVADLLARLQASPTGGGRRRRREE